MVTSKPRPPSQRHRDRLAAIERERQRERQSMENQLAVFFGRMTDAAWDPSTRMLSWTERLPHGWDRESARVAFAVPLACPFEPPRNFYGPKDIRLASGVYPRGSTTVRAPDGTTMTKFYGYVQAWDPTRDSLMTYAHVVRLALKTLAQLPPPEHYYDDV